MLKYEEYKRKGHKVTYGNRIGIGEAIIDGKKTTIYTEILNEDKKESMVMATNSYADAMRFAMSLLVKIMEHLLEPKEIKQLMEEDLGGE